MPSFLLLVASLGLAGVTAWGFVSTQVEISQRTLRTSWNSVENKFAVDPYIWSTQATSIQRRRYVSTQLCFSPSLLCMGAFVWTLDPSAKRGILAASAFGTIALLNAVTLAWKVKRHGL